jgi:hypothetical protein
MSIGPEDPTSRSFALEVGNAGEGRIARSWRLTQVAWALIRREPALLGLAAMQLAFTIVAAVLFVVVAPRYLTHTTTTYQPGTAGTYQPQHVVTAPRIVAVALAGWIVTFIGVFFGVALASAASTALRGKHATVKDALSIAVSRLPAILVWSLVASLVGLALRLIAERVPLGGRLLTWLVGLAWAIATFFVIPVIALEGYDGVGCVRRSGQLVKRRFGEGVSGVVIITLWTTAAMLGLVVCAVVGLVAVAAAPALGVFVLAVTAIGFVALVVVSNTVRQVFAVALYRYARDGDAIGGFTEADLSRPFAPRRSRR